MLSSVVLLAMIGWSKYLLINNVTLPEIPECNVGKDDRMQITITVPATGPPRHFAVYWWGRLARDDDRAVFFDYDPTSQTERPLDVVRPALSPNVFVSRLKLSSFQDVGYTPKCLMWAKYIGGGGQEDSRTCLQTQPNWMEVNRQHLSVLPLNKLFIPGTHNSGSIVTNATQKGIVWNYIMTQDLSILQQLLMGIRYLDLRIGYYTGDHREKFWVVHSVFKTATTLRTVLEQVREFMERTNEVVVLDFHRFPVGFEDHHVHYALWDFVLQVVGPEKMTPAYLTEHVQLGTLWSLNKRLVVCYNSKARPRHPLLWPGVLHRWADARTGTELYHFLEGTLSEPIERLWAATAALTPTYKSALLSPRTGLRDLADSVAYNLSQWYRDRWWHSANIVATDFFLSTAIVDTSILANIWRSYCPERYRWRDAEESS
ncbi:PI-PLC X domain-containing protein 2-like [Ornithodoros turicata]|uniref:PI-PLC X domain-containing protein 2-like n=1 Tax=Ornithodoros turicata TaxID=34597 RepID=UPI00313A3F9C